MNTSTSSSSSNSGGNYEWKWSKDRKANEITLSSDGLSISRDTKEGHNPAALTSQPLTRAHSHFRVQVKALGNWIGIGIADLNFQLSGSNTLGTQKTGVNSSYFWQSSGIKKIQMCGEGSTEVKGIAAGDIIDIKVDFDQSRIYYFNNNCLLGWISCTKNAILEGTLYPAANLSYGSKLTLKNEDVPVLDIHQKPFAYFWRWSTTHKAAAVQVSKDGLKAWRKDSPKGMNPAVLATEPLTKNRSHFRAQITKIGKWCGLGVCDSRFQVNDGKTLGTQKTSVNSAYFYQNSGINRLQMHGEISIDDAEPFKIGDIIDVKIDFECNRIYYFHNNRLQGYIAPTQNTLQDGALYPCVDMAVGTEIVLRNEDNPELDLTQKIKSLTFHEDTQDWIRPTHQFPTQWRWDTASQKKAAAIEVSSDGLIAKRESGGNNPAVMCSEPMTRNSFYFVVEIVKLGNWVGIGVGDLSFQLNGSKTLGQQTNGVNSSYFYQGTCRKLQMYKEQSISDVEPISEGDIIAVKIDFDNQTISYFNNDELQGTIHCTKNILKEGKIFACADMAAGTEIKILNVDHLPIVVSEAAF